MKKIVLLTVTVLSLNSLFAQKEKDEQSLKAIVSTLETSWNKKDGQGFASVFADVHDYIVVNGAYMSNFTKQGNAAAHQGLFDGVYKNRNVRLNVDKVQLLRPDLAMIYAFGAGYEKDAAVPTDPAAIMTILAEKKNNEWKIISFHNHNLEADVKERSPVPMQVMFRSWYSK